MKKIHLIVGLFLFFPGYIASVYAQSPKKPELIKLPFAFSVGNRVGMMENTPVFFNSRLLLVANYRPPEEKDSYLYIDDLQTGTEIIRFGAAHTFVSAFVNDKELNIFALDFSETGKAWSKNGISRLWTTDLKNFKTEKVLLPDGDEHLFNTSVCRDDKGFVMAYESEKPILFCFKFARSNDLTKWDKIPGLIFTGVKHEYSACPLIRYIKPFYYVIYLHAPLTGHNGWISYLARSRDLENWELSPFNPILEAGPGEGKNNSDVDIIEHQGKTYLYFATGDQETWGTVRVAMYDGLMKSFFENHFPEGENFEKISAKY